MHIIKIEISHVNEALKTLQSSRYICGERWIIVGKILSYNHFIGTVNRIEIPSAHLRSTAIRGLLILSIPIVIGMVKNMLFLNNSSLYP